MRLITRNTKATIGNVENITTDTRENGVAVVKGAKVGDAVKAVVMAKAMVAEIVLVTGWARKLIWTTSCVPAGKLAPEG